VDLPPPKRGVSGTTIEKGFAVEENNGRGDATNRRLGPLSRSGRSWMIEAARPHGRGSSSM
jgi:hypothetical protein